LLAEWWKIGIDELAGIVDIEDPCLDPLFKPKEVS
jgi:hypothetical protein